MYIYVYNDIIIIIMYDVEIEPHVCLCALIHLELYLSDSV